MIPEIVQNLFVYGLLNRLGFYLLIGGMAFVVVYLVMRRSLNHRKIQPRQSPVKSFKRDFFWSLVAQLTWFFFIPLGGIVAFTTFDYLVYFRISDHGWLYYLSSHIMVFLVHDAYFYWLHRLQHWSKAYRYLHQVHHGSRDPSPLAMYAIQPSEAIMQTVYLFLIAYTVPVHYSVFVVHLALYQLINVYGHLGYEIRPAWVGKVPGARFVNTATHHNMHHQYVVFNFSLYLNFWDRICGTLHPDYDRRLEKLANQPLLLPSTATKLRGQEYSCIHKEGPLDQTCTAASR